MRRKQLRIIGGQWRGRRLQLAATSCLRPTPDRVRETLFNWLQPWIEGVVCLDLFAGSGALGFEAISRGARSVVMVEQNPTAVAMLETNRVRLHAENVVIVRCDALSYLQQVTAHFDLVFLDPPFAGDDVGVYCQELECRGLLKSDALIYLETPRSHKSLSIPPAWTLIRSQAAGNVAYHLARSGARENVH